MGALNAVNRTMWTGDNLPVLRGLNSESVDLIYLDPPFNSNRDYAAPIGSKAAGAAFRDTWALSDVDEAWHGEIAEREPSVYAAIDAAGIVHGKGMKSYLIMMAVRGGCYGPRGGCICTATRRRTPTCGPGPSGAGRAGCSAASSTPRPLRALAVYFCTNLVGTLVGECANRRRTGSWRARGGGP